MISPSCVNMLALCFILFVALPFQALSETGSNVRNPMRSGAVSDRNDDSIKGSGKLNNQKQVPTKAAFFKQRQEREQLYEAYNLLHSLAQVSILAVNFSSLTS